MVFINLFGCLCEYTFFVKISASCPQVGFSMLSTKGMPSRTSKRILPVDQNAGHSKISTKGFAFKLDILKCPRKALPSNVFLRAGLSKASTKDFVHKLASLNYPRKVRLGGLLKEYDWLTKMVAIPKYPRKALPSNWIFPNVHERLCLQMYF